MCSLSRGAKRLRNSPSGVVKANVLKAAIFPKRLLLPPYLSLKRGEIQDRLLFGQSTFVARFIATPLRNLCLLPRALKSLQRSPKAA